jgi:hypothetical protein
MIEYKLISNQPKKKVADISKIPLKLLDALTHLSKSEVVGSNALLEELEQLQLVELLTSNEYSARLSHETTIIGLEENIGFIVSEDLILEAALSSLDGELLKKKSELSNLTSFLHSCTTWLDSTIKSDKRQELVLGSEIRTLERRIEIATDKLNENNNEKTSIASRQQELAEILELTRQYSEASELYFSKLTTKGEEVLAKIELLS